MTCTVCESILSPNKCPVCQVRYLCPECSLQYAQFYVCAQCHYQLTRTDKTISEVRTEASLDRRSKYGS